MLGLQPLRDDHLEAILVFERENRAYFASSVTDRGDVFYAGLAHHHHEQMGQQTTGSCAFYVLVDGDGTVAGRFNLYGLSGGAADLGYRVAERVTGQGVATRAVQELCRLAANGHGLHVLNAKTTRTNIASRRVLEKNGFAPNGTCLIGGVPGLTLTRTLCGPSSRATPRG